MLGGLVVRETFTPQELTCQILHTVQTNLKEKFAFDRLLGLKEHLIVRPDLRDNAFNFLLFSFLDFKINVCVIKIKIKILVLSHSRELDAFIGDEPTLLYAASKQKNCQLRLVGKSFFQSGFGLAFPKKSLWTKKFSDVLLSYEQFSIPQKLRETWLSGTCSKQDPLTVSGFLKMTVEDVSGAFMIVFIGMGLALLLLLVEFKVAKYGFPLSRIWTNDPNWKAERKFIPNLPSVKTPSSSDILELSFSRRRSNFLCTREETNASIHERPRGSVYDELADELSGNKLSDNELSRIDQLHPPHGESDLHLVVEDSDSGRGSLGNSKNAK